jgi:hypothetical protein
MTDDDRMPGWLCSCGHWQDDDFHCEHCGEQPPWGCDCDACNASYEDEENLSDDEDEEIFDDEEWEDE